jgi:hypothetical protein
MKKKWNKIYVYITLQKFKNWDIQNYNFACFCMGVKHGC